MGWTTRTNGKDYNVYKILDWKAHGKKNTLETQTLMVR
jgi:hypothetical protein